MAALPTVRDIEGYPQSATQIATEKRRLTQMGGAALAAMIAIQTYRTDSEASAIEDWRAAGGVRAPAKNSRGRDRARP